MESTMPTLSYLTLSGSKHGHPPKNTVMERAGAAKNAGFTSIGVSLDEELYTPAEVHALAETPEIEWWDLGYSHSPWSLRRLQETCQAYGVTRLNAGVCDYSGEPYPAIAGRLRTVAQAVRPYDVTVALEPVAFGLGSVEACRSILRMAQQSNAGLLLDMWQVQQDYRAHVFYRDMIAPEIVEIQMCGFPAVASAQPFRDSQDRQFLCESALDPFAWLARLRDFGCTAPVSIEIPSSKLRGMPVNDAAIEVAADYGQGI